MALQIMRINSMNLFCTQTQGSPELFNEMAYRKNGVDAVKHLFDVGAGLDSQILGDYEIVGQLRKAMKFAKERGFINSFPGPHTEPGFAIFKRNQK